MRSKETGNVERSSGASETVMKWRLGAGSYTLGAILDVLTVASRYLLRPWDTVGATDITKFAFMALV